MPKVFSPRDWNAIVDYDQWNDPFSPDDGVALHHGGGFDYVAGRYPNEANEIQQLQQWEGYHLYSKGWRGLAYGFGVGQTGNIYRIRGFNRYGAHTGDLDGDGIANNDEIVPIIFIGSGNHHNLSQAAQDSINWLRANVIEIKSPKAIKLYGHKELRGTTTSCPGPKGMEYVLAHRFRKEDKMTPEQEAKLDKVLELLDGIPEAAGYAVHGKDMDDPFHDDTPQFSTFVRRIYLNVRKGYLSARKTEAIVEELAKVSGLSEATIQRIAEKTADEFQERLTG